jgi:hypothetical protein
MELLSRCWYEHRYAIAVSPSVWAGTAVVENGGLLAGFGCATGDLTHRTDLQCLAFKKLQCFDRAWPHEDGDGAEGRLLTLNQNDVQTVEYDEPKSSSCQKLHVTSAQTRVLDLRALENTAAANTPSIQRLLLPPDGNSQVDERIYSILGDAYNELIAEGASRR